MPSLFQLRRNLVAGLVSKKSLTFDFSIFNGIWLLWGEGVVPLSCLPNAVKNYESKKLIVPYLLNKYPCKIIDRVVDLELISLN